ncbi:hypothetical protein [Bradyrhizobium sp. LMTR 3]|uniref:hypothetical protein n=1 Tax=Bradyrhizobium sp. LMTR 3 TaxID=189873 RepID=UPI001146DCA5|nr:hypothetical protein [Bradyrhizobium sp. LMTR 3]
MLDEAARRMVEEAQAASNDRIFSATGFAREHISIVHQQLRCTNLAWALGHTKRIKRGDVVAIVGGSFSALMLAVSIAITEGAIIYIFEKERCLLHRFLDKGHRHLSPNLNSRYLGKRFDPAWSAPFFEPPIFKWRRGVASSVAHEWLHEFDRHRRKLPIFAFLNLEVSKRHIKPRVGGLTIDLRSRARPHLRTIDVDLLIDATGFGEEGNPHDVADYSYWESGHRLIYDHLPKSCDVLVSGCGDSGLIEAMHYAMSGFRHALVENFWPSGANLEARLDIGLEEAKLDDILQSPEVERYDGRVISEVCWWLDTWFRLENWQSANWSLRSGGAHNEPIFKAIEDILRPHLKAAFPRRDLARLDWDERETFVLDLPLKVQLQAREAVRPLADAAISRGIDALAGTIVVGKLLRVGELHKRIRPGVRLTLNGTTPTPYTRQLSTYNVWLMRVLMSFPNVRYRQGRISKVTADRNGRFSIAFDDGTTDVFDRVVTRYGPSSTKGRQTMWASRPRDSHAGSWLLTPVSYTVPTKDKNVYRRIYPAIDRVKSRLHEVETRQASPRADKLDKAMYERCLFLKPMIATSDDPIYRDPQSWLSAKLRKGKNPNYTENILREAAQYWSF